MVALIRDPRASAVHHSGRSRTWPFASGRDQVLVISLRTLAALAVVLSVAEAPAVVRAPVVFAFLVIGPGLAALRLINLTDPAVVAVLSVATSLSLSMLLTELQALWGLWAPQAALAALAVLTVVLTFLAPLRGNPETDR